MFRPVSLYIGLRYTRSKRRNHFVSFISLASMLGIALSLVVLITVLSVFNGFDQQIKQRIFTMVPHITMTGFDGRLNNWSTLQRQVLQQSGVVAAAPFVSGLGLLTADSAVDPAMIEGILPDQQSKISSLSDKMISGSLADLKSGKFAVVLGITLASRLGVIRGDKINLLISQASVTPAGIIPRMRQFTVVGIFHVGTGFGLDSGYAFINLQDAQKLFILGQSVSGLQLKTNDLFAAPRIAQQLRQSYGQKYQVSDWTDQYGAFYHAVGMEKSMMFLILILLVLIAAFNLLSGLVMAVTDKRSDIAILRTLGATPSMIMKIFIVQGSIIGLLGTVLGVVLGLLLAANVTEVVNFLQNTFHVQLFTSNVYFVNYLPSKIEARDVIKVVVAALLLSVAATLYPSWRASRVQPVEALRYE